MTTKEKIAVMQAYEDGKVIQYRNILHSKWVPAKRKTNKRELHWDWNHYEYRVLCPSPCEGKVIEIDGKKYKLTSV
jgi:hypothetical protein